MVDLLRPGGVLVLIRDLGETFYTVGDQRFHCVRLSQDFIQQTLCELGLSVEQVTLRPGHERSSNRKWDYQAFFHLIAC